MVQKKIETEKALEKWTLKKYSKPFHYHNQVQELIS